MKKSYLMLLLVAMFALFACDNNDEKPQRSESSWQTAPALPEKNRKDF